MITIDPERVVGRIDPKVYGMFIEHLGRCIYGGIFDEGSPRADAEGYRIDVLKACEGLAPPILRWPGGNFASGYHWQDGVGPPHERPRRLDLAWFAEESNRFGTDEFIGLCRRLNCEPYICANAGTGTIEEAAAWVEYCNGWTNTFYANLRRRNGNRVPYNVMYWGLGNEVYGHWQIGHQSAEDYAKKAREMAKLMRWTDPRIKLVACGLGERSWDEPVLEALRGLVEYLSVHCYVGSSNYYENVSKATVLEDLLDRTEATIAEVFGVGDAAQAPVKIAVDEWNVWYRTHGGERFAASKLEEVYDLSDALCVATLLHVLQRRCRTVGIANLAQMVNVIAPILAGESGVVLQSIYHPLSLLRHHSKEFALCVDVRCEEIPTALTGSRPVLYLDAMATRSEDGRALCLSVVNRHESEPLRVPLEFVGCQAELNAVWEVNGPGVHAANSLAEPQLVTARKAEGLSFDGTYTFPAHSHTVMEFVLH
jgi:alpha-N-arabinofuranosidase